MAATTTLIPIQMCFKALKEKKTRALQVYVYLKFQCSGKIKLNKRIHIQTTHALGLLSSKTVKVQLDFLEEKHWITYSKRSGYTFIKGFDSIRRNEGYKSRRSAEFDLQDIKKFKGFLIASVLSYLIKEQKVRAKVVERKRRRSKTSAFVHTKYFPIANEALAKILNISISTAYQWKKLAEKHGYIKIRKNFQLVENVHPRNLNELKKFGDLLSQRLRVRGGRIVEQMPDEVSTNVYLRKRKKIFEK